jgi:flagellar protein FliL
MADEKKPNGEQEQSEESTPKASRFPIKKYGVYGGIVLAIVVAAYFVTLKVVKPMMAGGTPTEETTDKPHAKAEEPKKHESSGGHGDEDESAASDIHMIEGIIVNPSGTGGRRFLSASIGFELASPEANAQFDEREAVIRDALITILSSQTIPELSDFKQREKLRQVIKLRVEKLLNTKEVDAVYFTEFVLQ